MVALQALEITGEVITTPYSSVATTYTLWWNGIKPVFVDIEEKTGNLDPKNLPIAARIADRVICLPIYHNLNNNDIE